MSDDLMVILREGGRDRFHRSRYGGSFIGHLLLQGVDRVLAEYRQEPHQPGELDWWPSEQVFMDADAMLVVYNGFDGSAGLHRYYRRLLEPAWPGWELRRAALPVDDFGRAFGPPQDEQLRAICARFVDDLPTEPPDLPELDEYDQPSVWITVRHADGTVQDVGLPWTGYVHVVQAGPGLIDAIVSRDPPAHDTVPDEWIVDETLIVDVPARRLIAWGVRPPFAGVPPWPGWEIEWHAGGPREHEARLGRPPEGAGAFPPPARSLYLSLCTFFSNRIDDAARRTVWQLVVDEAPLEDAAPRTTSGTAGWPIGETAVDGRYRFVEHLHGDRSRGIYRATTEDGRSALVTLGMSPAQDGLEELAAIASRPVAGLTMLLDRGDVAAAGGSSWRHFALVEEEPAGQPLSALGCCETADVAAVGCALAEILREARAHELAVELRPELIYADRSDGRAAVTGVARCGVAALRAHPNSVDVAVMFGASYESPEQVLAAPEGSASDVFRLCLVLAWLAAGEHPFGAGGVLAQRHAIVTGERAPWRGGRQLGAMLDGGLATDPVRRVPPALLEEQLRRL